MKTIKRLGFIGVLAAVFTLSSCSEDEIGSTVTNYPVFTLNAPEQTTIVVPVGGEFNDPGAIATVGGEEVPVTTTYTGRFRGNTFTGTLDTNVSDIYTVEYSAINEDGFAGSVTREVIVVTNGDLVNSIEGLYRATVKRNGVLTAQYTDLEYVLIWKNADGSYEISDAIGGYYDIGRAYGVGYVAPEGIIVANNIATNDFSFPGTQSVGTFGGTLEITSMTVNPGDNSIDMISVWQADAATTYTFEIHLEQVEL